MHLVLPVLGRFLGRTVLVLPVLSRFVDGGARERAVTSLLLFATLALAASPTCLRAQGTAADYERAAQLEALTRDKVFRRGVEPNWLPGGARFWYRVRTGVKTHEFLLVDAEQGTRRAAFDHQRLATAWSEATGDQVAADALPLSDLDFSKAGRRVTFQGLGNRWQWDDETGELTRLAGSGEDSSPSDGALRAFHKPRITRRTGPESSIRFFNRGQRELQLFWLDAAGRRKAYGAVPPAGEHAQHTYAGHVWLVVDSQSGRRAYFEAIERDAQAVIESDTLRRPPRRDPDGSRDRGRSPNGRYRAFLLDHNVIVEDLQSGQCIPLSHDGSADDPYQAAFHWSPDSRKLVARQVKPAEEREVALIESSPSEQLQPRLHRFSYAKPGDTIEHPRLRLFDVERREQLPVTQDLTPTPWSIERITWLEDSSGVDFLYNQRGHQVLRLIRIDAASGWTRTIIDEKSDTFVDYAHKLFLHRVRQNAIANGEDDGDDGSGAGGELLWMSERDGWNHLYRFDEATGELLNAVTRGQWVVREVERVDEKLRQIWFVAGGIHPDQDPYYRHLCRVNFDGSGLVVLTSGNGTHRWEFSPDGRFLLDTWSRVDQPPTTELLRSSDGQRICVLERADWTALRKTGWNPPQPFTAKGRDGRTDIHGIIIRPSHFQPGRKYPVIEKIYAGPQGAFVPKEFGLQVGTRRIAELGFIVVQIDGMGTSHRSKAFHDTCWKNLADSGFPDRIAWLRAAAEVHPELDLERVGIYGGSAGGQSALRGLLAHGDFYRAAVADCGCHDNRMDKIWWNELWMGWPLGPHYREQSNATQAHRLQGKLLLIVGELDRNVDPASTMQVVDALVRADKDFDLLVMPGVGHGAAEHPYASRRRMDFFVRHLWQKEPRRDP